MSRSGLYRFTLAIGLLVSPACGKVNELADKAKQAVSEGTEAVKAKAGVVSDSAKEQLAMAGSCQLQLDSAVTANACYFRWIPQGAGRSSVLQLRSYRDPSQETFPSVFVSTQVAGAGLSELIGQKVPAQLFVQSAPDQPIWSCPAGSQVELKIAAVTEAQLSLEIVGGSVRNSHTGAMQTVTGKLEGVSQ